MDKERRGAAGTDIYLRTVRSTDTGRRVCEGIAIQVPSEPKSSGLIRSPRALSIPAAAGRIRLHYLL